MRRARNAEQKEERKQLILDTAWELFQTTPYNDINIIEVAKGAGLAKGTLYLYFKTKESLFLEVQVQQMRQWFAEVNEQLQDLEPPSSIEKIVELLTTTLDQRPNLTRLFAILHIILEHNIDTETARHFKHRLREQIIHTGGLLEKQLTFLKQGQGAHLILQAYALVIGVQNLANPAPPVQEAIESDPDLAIFKLDFGIVFSQTLTALLYGLKTLQEP